MKNIVIQFNRMDAAIAVLREVASWGREQGYRVWPDEWLTAEELLTPDAQPENFCIGTIDGEIACELDTVVLVPDIFKQYIPKTKSKNPLV